MFVPLKKALSILTEQASCHIDRAGKRHKRPVTVADILKAPSSVKAHYAATVLKEAK